MNVNLAAGPPEPGTKMPNGGRASAVLLDLTATAMRATIPSILSARESDQREDQFSFQHLATRSSRLKCY